MTSLAGKSFDPTSEGVGAERQLSPFGRYFSHPLTVECKSMEDLRAFLRKCRYVSDKEQFGCDDYWFPPEEFERTRKGDCEDFALYAWRQLLNLGYSARPSGGSHGRYGEGHAWVTFEQKGKTFLLEPQASSISSRLPRLNTLSYKPFLSIEWEGSKARFYQHEPRSFTPPITQMPTLVLEWLYFHSAFVLILCRALLKRLGSFSKRARNSRSGGQRP